MGNGVCLSNVQNIKANIITNNGWNKRIGSSSVIFSHFRAYNVKKFAITETAIIDIKIPGENGIEVLKKIKKANRSVIAIIINNYPFAQYRANCFENGADYFFDKSNEYGSVIETIEGLISSGSVEHLVHPWQVFLVFHPSRS